jgi:hypothetical protein
MERAAALLARHGTRGPGGSNELSGFLLSRCSPCEPQTAVADTALAKGNCFTAGLSAKEPSSEWPKHIKLYGFFYEISSGTCLALISVLIDLRHG